VSPHFCELVQNSEKFLKETLASLSKIFLYYFNVSSTKAKNGKNCLAVLTIFRHLRLAPQAANGGIDFTLLSASTGCIKTSFLKVCR